MLAAAHRASSNNSISPPVVAEPQTRDELLSLATERFCSATEHDRFSSEQYKEAFYLLIGTVGTATKQKIAQIISDCDYTPRSIALYFALEPVHIARPILSSSRTLGQLDLLRIVEMKSDEHSAIVATRPDIGPTLIKRLKRLNSDTVNSALADNFALPSDMTEHGVETLFAPIEEDSVNIPVAAKNTELTSAENNLLAAAARGGNLDIAVKSPSVKPLAIENFAQVFERAAIARSRQAMVVLMQKHKGLHALTAHQILDDKSGDTLAVFLRAADVPAAQANRIQLLSQPAIGLSVQNAARTIRFYAKLKKETCLAAIEEWPKQKGYGVRHVGFTEEGKPLRTETTSAGSTDVANTEHAKLTG